PGATGIARVACDGADDAAATGIERVPCDAAAAAPGATGIARVACDGADDAAATAIERVPCDAAAAAPGATGIARVACDGAGAGSGAAGIERVCDGAGGMSGATGIERVACGGGGGGLPGSGRGAPRELRSACVEVYLLGGCDFDGRRGTPVDSSCVTATGDASALAAGAGLDGAAPLPRAAGTRPVLRRPEPVRPVRRRPLGNFSSSTIAAVGEPESVPGRGCPAGWLSAGGRGSERVAARPTTGIGTLGGRPG